MALSRTFVIRNGEVSQLPNQIVSAATADVFRPGSIVDSKYKILGLIGRGGMGAVYKVHHLLLQKDMALKTILSQRFSPASWIRFQREVQAIAKLKHKNIVDVFDFGIDEERLPYYTMELLNGQSLAYEIHRSGRLTLTDALKIFGQVAEALAHAHRQTIVHRDVKPGNIILVKGAPQSGQHQAKLVDFGVAKLVDHTPIFDDQSLTQASTIFGSPLYMSPEQSFGLPVDHRTDIYSFGCAFYETLTGKAPFIGDTALSTILLHQSQIAPTLKESGIDIVFPQRLEAVIAKLLSKKPQNRYQSFDQVVEELDRCYKAIPPEPAAAGERKVTLQSTFSADPEGGIEASPKVLVLSRRWLAAFAVTAACLSLGAVLLTWSGLLRLPSSQPAIAPKIIADSDPVVGSRSRFAARPKIALSNKPYFVGLRKEKDGDKRLFYFPPDEQIGSFATGEKQELVVCSGAVSVPAKANLLLVAGTGLVISPELFRRFGANDLYGIQLAAPLDGDWSDLHLKEISRLTGLQMLEAQRAVMITSRGIREINKLKNLKSLKLSYSHRTAKDFTDLTFLPQLQVLDVSGSYDTSAILTYLSENNSRVETLLLDYCQLTVNDLAQVGKLKNLKVFSAVYNGITDQGLANLAPASQLQSLNLSNNNIDEGAIKYFGRYKALKDVLLSLEKFSQAGRKRLKQTLPANCTLDDVD